MEPQFPTRFAAFKTRSLVDTKNRPAPFPKEKARAKKASHKPSKRKPTLFELAKQTCEAPQSGPQPVELTTTALNQTKNLAKVEGSSSVQDLIHVMSDVIMIEKNKGISRSEIHLEMLRSDSPFKGGVLFLDHYDTHPHAFNIDFFVEQVSGQALFNDNIAHLEGHLKAVFPSFEFNISKAGFNTTTMAYTKDGKKQKRHAALAKTGNKASLSLGS